MRSQPGRADGSSVARPGDRLRKSPVARAQCDRRRSPGAAAGLRNPRVGLRNRGCAIGAAEGHGEALRNAREAAARARRKGTDNIAVTVIAPRTT
jgi:hypothetical protein